MNGIINIFPAISIKAQLMEPFVLTFGGIDASMVA
jgi:hypothetical protein